ncbi:MAG: FG-GAP-like repeat-containing protein [Candidatus Eisenbacteria bacterium]
MNPRSMHLRSSVAMTDPTVPRNPLGLIPRVGIALAIGVVPCLFSLSSVYAAITDTSPVEGSALYGWGRPAGAGEVVTADPATSPAPIQNRSAGLLPGWPQTMGFTNPFSPVGVVLADVDGNGDLEVIAGSTDNKLRVWDHDGTLLPGWPVTFENQIQGKAAAADLDGDGDLEILANVKSGSLKILHHDGTPLAGWPQTSNLSFGFLSPVVYDLDGDGSPEVLVGGGNRVSAWHADGTPVTGFPVTVGSTIVATLAVGDVTGDDVPEIFVQRSSVLESFQIDGTATPGFPVTYGLSASYAAPSIGDIDNDGSREVLCVGYNFGNFTQVHAFHGDGSAVTGFPVQFPSAQTYGCPVLGDMDDDGDLEVFVAGKISDAPTFYGWDHTGAVLPGWPTLGDANMEGSAILANFDLDATLEVAVGTNSGPGEILGYNLDGSVVTDFPIVVPGGSGPNSPELGDVEPDGDLDLAYTMLNGQVAVWDLGLPYDASTIDWGTLFHDDWNTNQYGFVPPAADPSSVPAVERITGIHLGQAQPNPSTAAFELAFVLPEAQSVELSVVDAAGRFVTALASGVMGSGEHRVEWNGENASGQPMPSGVYFLRLADEDGRAQSRRVVLAR